MPRFYPWIVRILGITVLTALTLFVFFRYIGQIDVGWALPWTRPFHAHWPDLPRFVSWTTTTPDGRRETLYQVSSHVLTQEEIAHLRYVPPATTNAAPATSPVPPTTR